MAINVLPKRKLIGEPLLETYKFVPNTKTGITLEESLGITMQVAYENIPSLKIRTAEILDDFSFGKPPLSPIIQEVLNNMPLVQADVNILTNKDLDPIEGINITNEALNRDNKNLLVVTINLSRKEKLLKDSLSSVAPNGFILTRESKDFDPRIFEINENGIKVILVHDVEDERLVLLRKSSGLNVLRSVVDVDGSVEDWLPVLQKSVKSDPCTVVLGRNNGMSGILGLVNCIRREPGCGDVSCVFIMDKDAPRFELTEGFYKEQLDKGLGVNVYKDGCWGM